MENMLALIEFTQFKDYTKNKIDDKEADGLIQITFENEKVILPDGLPCSILVDTKWSDDEVVDIKTKAYQIYKKYVEFGSSLEINISHIQRQAIVDVLDDLEELLKDENVRIIDLYRVFDDAIGEMIQLLKMSVTRFRFEIEFREIVHENATGRHSKKSSLIAIITGA